jgi:hypothetical protein
MDIMLHNRQNVLIKEIFPQHTHDLKIQESMKIKKNRLSKMIIILSNIVPGSKVSTFKNAV